MRLIFSTLMIIVAVTASQGQWSPDFSTSGKGINDVTSAAQVCNNTDPSICPTYDVSGMNWYLTGISGDPFNFQFSISIPPQYNHAKAVSGEFWTQDPDGDICITSPVLNIAGLGTVTASYSVFRSGNCAFGNYSSADDGVYSSYSINGGAFVNTALFQDACGNSSTWTQTFSGNTAVVRLCLDANSENEDYAVTDMSVNLGTPLPVKWSGFFINATTEGFSQLKWQTASEINNDYFEVERSMDGIFFSTVGQVKGSGNKSEPTNYAFTDKTTKAGNTYYYRVKQVDYDGKEDHSIILSIDIKGNAITLSVEPNPVYDMLKINLNSPSSDDFILEVFRLDGSLVQKIEFNEGEISKSFDMTFLTNGLYILKSKGSNIINQKIIKANH